MANDQRNFIWKNKKYFMGLLKTHKWAIINGQIMSNIEVLIGTVLPLLLKLVIDYSLMFKDFHSFIVLFAVIGILYAARIFLFFVIDLNFVYVMHGFHVTIAKKVYKKIHRLRAKDLEKISTGELIYQTNVNSGLFWDTIFWSFFYLLNPTMQFGFTLIFIILIDYKAACIMMLSLLIATYLSNNITEVVKKEQKILHDLNIKHDGFLYNTFDSLRDISLLNCSNQFSSRIEKQLNEMHESKVRLAQKEYIVNSLISFMQLACSLLIYIYLAYSSYKNKITIGEFVTLITYWEVIKGSFTSINFYLLNIKKRASGLDSVIDLLEKTEEDQIDGLKLIKHQPIEINNLTFRYNEIDVLQNLKLQIRPNERIAIVGESGSGKSTIVKLLTKQYDVEDDTINIFGRDINKLNIDELRDAIGVVYQEPYMFEGSIRYNVMLGNKRATEEEVIQSCKLANIWEYISKLPLGLDTVIGREDSNLSWGQKQRICIARIFLKDPMILIFDEATSALDSEGEKIIKETWERLVEDRTVINVSHRLTTIYDCDRIAVLASGTIQDIGTHNELINQSKEYQKLFATHSQ